MLKNAFLSNFTLTKANPGVVLLDFYSDKYVLLNEIFG